MAHTERSLAAMSTSVSANTAVYDGLEEEDTAFLPEATSNLGTPWYLSEEDSAGAYDDWTGGAKVEQWGDEAPDQSWAAEGGADDWSAPAGGAQSGW